MSVSAESEDVRDCDDDNNVLSQPSQQEEEVEPSSVQGLSVQTVGHSASFRVAEGEGKVQIMVVGTRQHQDGGVRQEKSCLLHTKSYLMNSLLHLEDRNKILFQLSKQTNLDRQSRNIYHGKIYNYVLPAPRMVWTNKKQVRLP